MKEVYDAHLQAYPNVDEKIVRKAIDEITKETMRKQLSGHGQENRRTDARRHQADHAARSSVLPRTHGSALFTRGETQALAVTTFGTSDDEQKIESIHEGESYKSFMLHYNFPPFSVGEVKLPEGAVETRDRPRPPRRAGPVGDTSVQGRFPLHDTHRFRDPRIERLLLDGLGLRRVPLSDGRGRPGQGAGRGHRHGASHAGRQ